MGYFQVLTGCFQVRMGYFGAWRPIIEATWLSRWNRVELGPAWSFVGLVVWQEVLSRPRNEKIADLQPYLKLAPEVPSLGIERIIVNCKTHSQNNV